jgi:Mg2+-importing ATPase
VDQFRTGWFLESVISASLIVLVIRTRKPFFRSRPGRLLLLATLLVIGTTLILPYTPLARVLGFVPVPWSFLLALAVMMALYIAAAEVAKSVFYRHQPALPESPERLGAGVVPRAVEPG